MSQSKRVAIITGAAEGIGRGIATRLAKDGLDLGLFDLPRAQDRMDELAESLRNAYGVRVVTAYGDVSKEEDVEHLVNVVVEELGSIYAMIANAGVCVNYVLHETSNDDLNRLLDINVKGVFYSYKHAAKRLIEQGTGGRLIGAASMVSKTGAANMSVYSATKFAVRGLTQSAAMDYAKFGITANSYSPGVIETPLLDGLDAFHTGRSGEPRGSWTTAWNTTSLLGRNGHPEDVAKLVSFLVSDESAFITGQSYSVDGGICFD